MDWTFISNLLLASVRMATPLIFLSLAEPLPRPGTVLKMANVRIFFLFAACRIKKCNAGKNPARRPGIQVRGKFWKNLE